MQHIYVFVYLMGVKPHARVGSTVVYEPTDKCRKDTEIEHFQSILINEIGRHVSRSIARRKTK